MEYIDWILMVLLGVFSGAYGVLVGAGGGFILSPMLLLLFDTEEPEMVAGTVLAAIAINSILVAIRYIRMKVVDYRSALLFAGAAAPGAVIGAFGVSAVAPEIFRTLFGILLLLLALQLAFRPNIVRVLRIGQARRLISLPVSQRHITTATGQEYRYEFNETLATSFNVVLGFISSFFGIGGGFLRTPVLVLAFGFPVRIAAASSVFALAIYGSAGALTHGYLGNIELFPTLLFIGTGLAAGGQIGAMLSGRIGGVWVMRMLLVVVFLLGVRLIWQGVAG
ncbi:MAG: sulfite exporter TauE/SafE family protein [Dehalococcoidia bacterium]|nr:sulfite exporter TauE/SafE family protein [Dehalococcoidia bacterium]